MFKKIRLAISSRCGRAQAVTTLVRYAGNVDSRGPLQPNPAAAGRMNHRGSGVTEDSSAKYAKERQKFFGFHFRNQYLCPSLKSVV